MNFQSELCHIEDKRVVVRVTAWNGNTLIESSLGEAGTAEVAEDRAIERLKKRLGLISKNTEGTQPEIKMSTNQSGINTSKVPVRQVKKSDPLEHATEDKKENKKGEEISTNKVPVDWSDELAEIDFEINRIGWDRSQEIIYLKRCLGYSNRNKIINYTELKLFISLLKNIEQGIEPTKAIIPDQRTKLMNQCDQLLTELGWDTEQAISELESQMKVKSRTILSDEDLLKFNMHLEQNIIESSSSN